VLCVVVLIFSIDLLLNLDCPSKTAGKKNFLTHPQKEIRVGRVYPRDRADEIARRSDPISSRKES